MRIAVITSSYPRFPGDSTAPFVKSICEHLAKLGHAVEVVAPHDPAVVKIETHEVPVHRFHYIWPESLHIMGHARALEKDVHLRPLTFVLLPFFLIAAFLRLMSVTREQKSEAIHAHWVIPNGLVAAWVAALRKIPFIVSLHGSDIFVARRNPIFGAVARWVFRRAASVTACSSELQRAAIALGAPEATRLLAWGADPQVFRPDRRSPENPYAPPGDDKRIIVASLGRMVYKKGFDNLIKAMSIVVKEHPQAHLLLGGDGALKDQLHRQVEQLGISQHVSFTGAIPWDQVPDFLANVDIFVLPSVRDQRGNVDGLPTVLLEAMGSETAVIASDIGGVSLVIEDQRNGLLVPPGDVDALVASILDLLKDSHKRTALSQEARRVVQERYNWDQVAITITELLQIAIWRRGKNVRLGTIYRQEVLTSFSQETISNHVLDVGCHDGYILSTLNAPVRIGVDLEPDQAAPGISMIRADGRFLPFRGEAFDTIYALDVIEHVDDDRSFVLSLIRVLSPGGTITLSTPSQKIRLNPPFLTQWISRQWGHHLRLGYTPAELVKLFENNPGVTIQVSDWNAPAYRFWYLPVRLLATIWPSLTTRILRLMAQYDSQHQDGETGFIVIQAYKDTSPRSKDDIGENVLR